MDNTRASLSQATMVATASAQRTRLFVGDDGWDYRLDVVPKVEHSGFTLRLWATPVNIVHHDPTGGVRDVHVADASGEPIDGVTVSTPSPWQTIAGDTRESTVDVTGSVAQSGFYRFTVGVSDTGTQQRNVEVAYDSRTVFERNSASPLALVVPFPS